MKRYLPAILLMVFAAILLVIGIANGDPVQVMYKAIRVCMECVGIG